MIQISNVSKSYDQKKVLSNISFSVGKGQIFGIMGKNGAGKTTLVRSILDQVSYEGEIQFSEHLKAQDGRLQNDALFFVRDTPHIYDYLTAIEYVQFVLKLKHRPLPETERIEKMLVLFGIPQYETTRLLKNYSFGMKRKVVLATAFLLKPDLIVMDEPTIGLDVPSVITLKKLIRASAAKGYTFLVTSHDPSLMSEVCDGLVILNDQSIAYLNTNLSEETRNLSQLYMDKIGEDVDAKVDSILDL